MCVWGGLIVVCSHARELEAESCLLRRKEPPNLNFMAFVSDKQQIKLADATVLLLTPQRFSTGTVQHRSTYSLLLKKHKTAHTGGN